MVCVRCKMAVKSILDELHIDYLSIGLCKVELAARLTDEQQMNLAKALKYYELELMDTRLAENKKRIIAERIKALIIEMLQSPDLESRVKLSVRLSSSLHYDYTYLANMFSETEEITIERFYILSRIERVKELIAYGELSLKEISYQLNYSSQSHLCFQFKKITGQTPLMFKKLCGEPGYIWK